MILFKCKTTNTVYQCTKDEFMIIKLNFYNMYGFSVLFDNFYEVITNLEPHKPIIGAIPNNTLNYVTITDDKSNYPPIY